MISAEYAAGFFDGEGTVDIRHSTRGGNARFELRVSATQKDGEVLYMLAEAYGGTVCPSGHVMRWLVAARKAHGFLLDIEPHAIVKRDEIMIALKFYGDGEWGRKSNAIGRGFAKTSSEEVMRRLGVMAELRGLRSDKGFAKQNRNPLPCVK